MLDIHPIHAPVNGWRDFWVHIAIIVLGLCIAVGIQQTVEFVHNRYQLSELRQALRLEREENYKKLTNSTELWRWGAVELENNLMIFEYLRQHPGTPQEKLPGVLFWSIGNDTFTSAVWDAAHQSGVIAVLPREEVEAESFLHFYFEKVNDQNFEVARTLVAAQRYNFLDSDPSHLSPVQIAAEIELTQAAMTAHFISGSLLRNLADNFPDFPPTLTPTELHQMRNEPDSQTKAWLAPARALTMDRLKAAGYVDAEPPRRRNKP